MSEETSLQKTFNADECEYFLVGDSIYPEEILVDTQTVPRIRNTLNLEDQRIWITEPVLHAGLARMLTKRNLAYNFHLKRIHRLKCVFILLSGNLTSGGNRGSYCYDMNGVNQPATKQCDIELAFEYMESFNTKVIIKIEENNGKLNPTLSKLSHKMPLLTYDNANKKFFQICKERIINIPSIQLMKNPWNTCPITLRKSERVPIIKG